MKLQVISSDATNYFRDLRILFVSFAVPSPVDAHLGSWNVRQCLELQEAGAVVKIVRPTFPVPAVASVLGQKFSRRAGRPANYQLSQVDIECPPVLFAYPAIFRNVFAERAPFTLGRLLARTVGPALTSIAAKFEPDLLIVQPIMPFGLLACQISNEFRVPLLFIERSAIEIMSLRNGDRRSRFYRQCISESNGTTTDGMQMAEHLKTLLGVDNVHHLPSGVDSAEPQSTDADWPHDLRGKTVVLCVSNYYRRKGIEELVDAFCRIVGDFPNAVLVLVTELPANVLDKIQTSAASDQFRMVGRLSHDEVLKWMRRADLFALPSWNEAFANVYSEALSAGTPVLMTSDCGVARVINAAGSMPNESHQGWIVKPRDVDDLVKALRSALSNPHILRLMRPSCQRLAAEQLSWKSHLRKLELLLKSCNYKNACE